MKNTQYTVTNASPTLIFSGTGRVLVQAAAGQAVYLGDGSVTAGDGVFVPSQGLQMDLCAPAKLYAIGLNATQDVRVLSWH